MPGVYGIAGGDPRERPARLTAMAAALGVHGAAERWGGALVGVISRPSDGAATAATAGRWRVLLEGRAEGIGAADALADWLDRDGPARLGGLDGWHTGAACDGERLRVFTGFLGIEPLYWAQEAEALIFAPEVKAVRAALSRPAALDTGAGADLIRFGHPLGTDTVLAGVATLEPGHRLEWDAEGVRFVPTPAPPPPAEPEAWIREHWPRLVARCFDRPGRRAGLLSGGLDSRAVMLAAPPDVPVFTFGRAGSLDVELAGTLARAMGREHRVFPLPEDFLAADAEALAWRHDGMVNPCHSPGTATNLAVAARCDHLASGAFGDLVFGTRWRPSPASPVALMASTVEQVAGGEDVLVAPLRGRADERLERASVPTAGDPARARIGVALRHRMRRFTAAAIADRRHHTETLHPLYSRELLAAIEALPLERLQGGRAYMEMILALGTDVAHVAWARTGAPLFADEAVIRRVAAARRRERGWDRLLRNLRLGGRWDPTKFHDVGYLLRTNGRNRRFLQDALEAVRAPVLDRAGVATVLGAHLHGRRDHSTLLGRVLALELWYRRAFG
jgi:hypothetical protein